MKRRSYQISIDAMAVDRLRDRALRDGVSVSSLVERACSAELAVGDRVIAQQKPGDCAREMFRIARPEVPR